MAKKDLKFYVASNPRTGSKWATVYGQAPNSLPGTVTINGAPWNQARDQRSRVDTVYFPAGEEVLVSVDF